MGSEMCIRDRCSNTYKCYICVVYCLVQISCCLKIVWNNLIKQFFKAFLINWGIFIVDFHNKIVDANQSACDLVEVDYKQLISMNIFSLFAPDTIEDAKKAIEIIKNDGFYRYESKFQKSRGKPIDVEISAKVINDEQGIFQIFARNITERKQKELALLESQKTLKRILENVQTGIIIIDARDRRIVDVNVNALQIIGAPKEKVIGSRCFDHICPRKVDECPFLEIEHGSEGLEAVILNEEGEKITVLKNVTPVMLNGRRHLVAVSYTHLTLPTN